VPIVPAPRLLPLGDSAWTVEFGSTIDELTHARVMGLSASLAHQRLTNPLMAGVSDVVSSFRSLTVHFDPWTTDGVALGHRLLDLAVADVRVSTQGRHWWLPVCFDDAFGPDWSRLCEAKGVAREDAVQQLLDVQLRVYLIGFQPGFPYMGGVPSALQLPRLPTPRQKVPAQTVALAGEMCAVYPWESPGGWNLLGRTPVVLFDLRHTQQPAMLSAGDTVRWYAVDRAAHDALSREVARGLPRETFLKAPIA
jgi:inhibitor of KinA